MLTLQHETEAGAEQRQLAPGRHTAGDDPADPIQLPGAGPSALALDVTAAGLVVLANRPGARLSGRPLQPNRSRLLRPGERLEMGSGALSVVASEEQTGTAIAARELLAGVSPQVPALLWLTGPDCGRRLVLDEGETLLGRGEGCQARIRDPLASRAHARLTLTATGALLEPLACRNPLHLDGEPIDAARELGGGELLQIGDTELAFEARFEPPAAEPEPPGDAPPAEPEAAEETAEPTPVPPPARKRSPAALTLGELAILLGGTFAAAGGAALSWLLAR